MIWFGWHGTLTGKAPELKPWGMWVRLPPVLLPVAAGLAFGRAVGRQAACKAAALRGNVGSIPTRGTADTARSSNGEDASVSTWW